MHTQPTPRCTRTTINSVRSRPLTAYLRVSGGGKDVHDEKRREEEAEMGGSDESDIDDPMEELSPEELKQLDPKKHARAQHNALERRRRDNIKDMYSNLGRTVADTSSERASRAQILRKAIESIEEKQNECRKKEAELAAIEAENAELERRCRELLEKRKSEMDLRGAPGSPNSANAFVSPAVSQ
ncbi:hypothetical protein PENTCL1PPCAC_29385 [Pristionchus entomophagus]|uniref:BHLH domain-containing protein n=1 Tax=Pristionchus entomophagus TaxID=358040 RepID=A0AAV5UJH7_9BILA|nr:hypothetical protein PENTCL1PPCAC_29385 [Pristionchus entomophagus]